MTIFVERGIVRDIQIHAQVLRNKRDAENTILYALPTTRLNNAGDEPFRGARVTFI